MNRIGRAKQKVEQTTERFYRECKNWFSKPHTYAAWKRLTNTENKMNKARRAYMNEIKKKR